MLMLILISDVNKDFSPRTRTRTWVPRTRTRTRTTGFEYKDQDKDNNSDTDTFLLCCTLWFVERGRKLLSVT